MQPQTLDLFGQVIVTTRDVEAWLVAVPRIDPTSRRAAFYVKDYNVVGKIESAKLAGLFDQITTLPDPPPEQWWSRFSWIR